MTFIFLSCVAFFLWRSRLEKTSPLPPSYQVSIAVLPFDDLSPGKDQAGTAEGISEAIISALSNLEEIKIPARTSSFSFRDKDIDIREIAQMLGVDNVLEGSVQVAGDRLRVTAQLINAEDGYHLWSERYDLDWEISLPYKMTSHWLLSTN